MTDLLPSIQTSLSDSDIPQFTRPQKQTSMTDLSHNPEVSIVNIFGELTHFW